MAETPTAPAAHGLDAALDARRSSARRDDLVRRTPRSVAGYAEEGSDDVGDEQAHSEGEELLTPDTGGDENVDPMDLDDDGDVVQAPVNNQTQRRPQTQLPNPSDTPLPPTPAQSRARLLDRPRSGPSDSETRQPQLGTRSCVHLITGVDTEAPEISLPSASTATDPSLAHLREISSLASWTVSSFKPGCGVPALLNPSTSTFWQSDGPQPHLLNIHFFKLVRIVKLRVYLDHDLDESYTPTRLAFAAGTHEYDAVEFAEWRWQDAGPKGWVDVDLSNCGSEEDQQSLAELAELAELAAAADGAGRGGEEGGEGEGAAAAANKCLGVLRCFFLQIRVLENHQNGKDTHVRGVQIFARDERARRPAAATAVAVTQANQGQAQTQAQLRPLVGESDLARLVGGLFDGSWTGEAEIR